MQIHSETNVGRVILRVSDLGRSLAFYNQALGFRVLSNRGGRAVLGAGSTPLLELDEIPGAAPKPRRTTGLYHFAILVPGRAELAQSLARLVRAGWPLGGASDHGVSEALYLDDPDGNGIEIYRDRERSQWPRQGEVLRMGIEPLDVEALLAEGSRSPLPAELHEGTRMGHVHLHVRDLAEAERFYHDALGFDVMQRMAPSALFVSAGGYHHHLGLNTWAGVGAPPQPENTAGLSAFTITLPNAETLAAVRRSLEETGISAEQRAEGWLIRDPSHNAMLLTTG